MNAETWITPMIRGLFLLDPQWCAVEQNYWVRPPNSLILVIRGYGVAVVVGRFQASLVGTASGKVPSGLTLALTIVLPGLIGYR